MAKKYYFVFCKEDLLLEKKTVSGSAEVSYTIPLQEEPPTELKPWTNVMNITPLDGVEVKTYRIDAPVIDDERYEMCGLRQSYYRLDRPLYLKAGKCQELLYWDQNTKYCGICGAPMRMDTDISKKCTQCGKEIWQQPGRKTKRFCSDSCRYKWWNSHPNQLRRESLRQSVCPVCGKTFSAYGSRNRKYCSHDCYIFDRFGGEQ